jgi:hypothetical protein
MPIEASARPCDARAGSFALVISSKSVVFPVEPNPISAALSMRRQGYPKALWDLASGGEQKAKIKRNLLMRCVLRLTSTRAFSTIGVEICG